MTLQYIKTHLFADIKEIPAILQQSHLPALDGLRGISIMLVIIGHMLSKTPLEQYFEPIIGVKIFFVISGFLITTLLLKEKVKTGRVSFKGFYIRRALRIIPVSYLFLLILLLFNSYFKVSTFSFVAAFLYLKNIPLKEIGEWYTGHFWSLSVEEQFYVLFPFLMITYLNKYIRLIGIMILVLPILNILCFCNIGVFYSNKMLHLICVSVLALWGKGTVDILVGSLLSILVFKKVIIIEKLKGNYFLSFLILAMIIVVRTIYRDSSFHYFIDCFIPFLIGYMILLNLKGKNLLRDILNNKILVQIGILSYSLYIWQQIFTVNLGADYIKMIYHLIALFGVAFVSYYFFEKQFLKLKSLIKPSAAVSVPLVVSYSSEKE